VWVTAGRDDGAGVYVIEPDATRTAARLLTVIKTPEPPTNCTFGGATRDVLYITTERSLFRIKTTARGRTSPPGK
jgi:sugar lactone lactonase YvrE